MADLVGLYKESGLAGIVPHAFKKNSKAFNFLVEKLKTEPGLCFLKSVPVNRPFIGADDVGICAYIYVDEAVAELQKQKLAKASYATKLEPMPEGKERTAFFERLRDIGVDQILINDAIHIPLTCYVSSIDYDGYKDINHLIRNAEMNATLSVFCQDAAADKVRLGVQEHLCDLLRYGNFLVPGDIVPVETYTSPEDLSFQTIVDAANHTFLPCFTDWTEFTGFMSSQRIKEGTYGGYVIDWETLRNLLEANPDVSVALNPQTANLKLDLGVMAQMMTHSLNLKAMRKPSKQVDILAPQESPRKAKDWNVEDESGRDDDDPMPDWLR